jgi:hypothetical protein
MPLSRCVAILCTLFVLSATTPRVDAAEVKERITQSSGTIPDAASDGVIRLAHCCHSHPLSPHDQYCCHSGAAHVARGAASYHAYKSVKKSVKSHAKRPSRPKPRRRR